MRIQFLTHASAELERAVDYYNAQSNGLGFEFAAEVKRTLGRIIRYPDAWHPLSQRTRRCRTSRFPYGVIYQVRGPMILIVAVMHFQQHPRSWASRLKIP